MAHRHENSQQQQNGGASPSRALAVATLLALVGSLLVLSVAALAAFVVGLAVPALLLLSPVLIPAAMLVAVAATGMAASGTLGLGALALLSRLASAARKAVATPPDYVAEGKRRVAELAGEKTSHIDAGQVLES
jgi:hypothetical protein